MKEYNEDENIEIDENGVTLEELSTIAGYGQKSMEQNERHARINAGFHDYDEDIFVEKKMIGNLCDQYRVFFEDDPRFSEFLKNMKDYAETDPYKHENYIKERKFVGSIPKKLQELNDALDLEEQKFQLEIRQIDLDKYFKLSKEEKAKFDRKYVLKQETLDNRRRALISFEVYFESMTKGEMNDLDDVKSFDNEHLIEEADRKNAQNGGTRTITTFKNKEGVESYYINSSGVKLNLAIDGDGLNAIQKTVAKVADFSAGEKKLPDAPIFPHEPRMTDVSQHYSGECYLYTALQNMARLYPQKIKEMIKDNGDGTATVRLYGKKFDDKTQQATYIPVYVKVDKMSSTFGAFGAEFERMGEDCLWVNLIERAYAMSGLHKTFDKSINLPIDPEKDPDNRNWKPSVVEIEGGFGQNFLETMLGPEGKIHKVDLPAPSTISGERERLEQAIDSLNIIKNTNINDAESITRHAFYKLYAEKGGKLSEKEFHELSNRKLLSNVDTLFTEEGLDFEKIDIAYDYFKKTVEYVLESTKDRVRNETTLTTFLAAARDKAERDIEKDYNLSAEEASNMERILERVYYKLRPGLMDIALAVSIPKREETDKFFNQVKNAIDKGLPISCGTHSEAKNTILADERHAYSIIGAFPSEDVPPRYYFRIKNPHTKLDSPNGVEYTNEEGHVVGKWVNVKDGIFDMEMEDFLKDFEHVHYNGDDILSAIPHKNIVGYDIITPEQVKENEETHVTNDKLTDYMKCANDLYDAMICTNSKYSNDSEEYKDLLEGIKQFRHNMACAQGRKVEDLKKLTQPLIKLVEKYEHHVDSQLLGPSKRQTRRKNVCTEIRNVVTTIEEGKNPHQEYEKEYAKTLINKYYDMNSLTDKTKIDEVATRLYNNKAFRGVANNTNIVCMKKPLKNQLEKDLASIEKSLEGRGLDKKIDLVSKKPKEPEVNNAPRL